MSSSLILRENSFYLSTSSAPTLELTVEDPAAGLMTIESDAFGDIEGGRLWGR